MSDPSKPAGSRWHVHARWTAILVAISGVAAYLGWAGVQNVSIPTARDWVSREPGLAVSDLLPRAGMGYVVAPEEEEVVRVPRVLVQELPDALTEVEDVSVRKRMFVRTVLPLVLEINRLIRRDRTRLLSLQARRESGRPLSAPDRRWLAALADEYRLEERDVDALLMRVDAVPPSLALAQAANESAWGRSRFAQEGNALFGQWSWDGDGIVPKERPDGEKYRVRHFQTPLASVYAYMRNLNTHPYYRRFRQMRAELKAKDADGKGLALAGTLQRYSVRGKEYIAELRQMIRVNDFQRFNNAVLVAPPELFAFDSGLPEVVPPARAGEG